MTVAFDPYKQWLGIAAERRPPTHYDILGVKVGESRSEIIERHAQRQKQKLREHVGGANGRLAKRLLFEINAAASCLADEDKRTAYERSLRISSEVARGGTAVTKGLGRGSSGAVSPATSARTAAARSPAGQERRRADDHHTTDPLAQALREEGTSPPGAVLLRRPVHSTPQKSRGRQALALAVMAVALLVIVGLCAFILLRGPRTTETADTLPGISPELPRTPPPPPPPPTDATSSAPAPADPTVPREDDALGEDEAGPQPATPRQAPVVPESGREAQPALFARLPDSVDLPESRSRVVIGKLSDAERDGISAELLGPDIGGIPRLWLRPAHGNGHRGVWRIWGEQDGGSETTHIATVKCELNTLVFEWERDHAALAGWDSLRNCTLRVMHNTHHKHIPLRRATHVPPITIDFSKRHSHVAIDGKGRASAHF